MSALQLNALAVLDDLRAFVGDEFEQQRRVFAGRIALPQHERVELGACLEGLSFVRLDQDGPAIFHHGGNDSKLREGDRILLSQGDPRDGMLASIYREEGHELWLINEKPFDAAMFMGKEDGWVIDEAFIDLERQYLEALDRVPGTAVGQERILPLLMGEAETALDEEEYQAAFQELVESPRSWEDAQREAIAGCLAADHCYLVQGPPGTGKTHVLAQVVRQLVERGERVLVTAFTHRAIDNALRSIAREVGDRTRVARFQDPVHRRDENFDRYERFSNSPLANLRGGWVAAATPFALKRRLSGVEFDVIVVDEAGQMTTPLAIMAMLTGRKYLFFGDQQQLGPVTLSRSRRDARLIGIFHALRDQESCGTRLNITYRLNDALVSWPSDNFYEGELTAADGAAHRRLVWGASANTPPWISAALDPERSLVWVPFDHCDCRTMSEDEVTVAAQLLCALHAGGVRPADVAVVTPFRKQARRLRSRVETRMRGTSWRDCVMDTVERMQGQEREVIIVSLCASDLWFIRKLAEFLYDPRRLNVSATRARTKLIILASNELFHRGDYETDLQEDISLLQSLKRCATLVEVTHES